VSKWVVVAGAGIDLHSYASAVSSSWSVRAVCRSVAGRLIAEYASPVCEKVESSTPVMRTPSATGKVFFWAEMAILCRTMLFRSPWLSALPWRSVTADKGCTNER